MPSQLFYILTTSTLSDFENKTNDVDKIPSANINNQIKLYLF